MKLLTLLLAVLLLSCEQPTSSRVDVWLRNENLNLINATKLATEEKGNRPSDVKVVKKMKSFRTQLDQLTENLNSSNRAQLMESVRIHIDTLLANNRQIQEFFTISENSDLEEIRLQLAVLERETLNQLMTQLAPSEVIFDSLGLFFIPDQIHLPANTNLKGTLVFGAIAAYDLINPTLTLDGQEVDMISKRGGLLNIPPDELPTDNSLSARVELGNGMAFENEIKIVQQ
jgi:hypothetical protein